MARIATTKNQWKDYYKCLLNKGLATIETIRQEYYDYEDRGSQLLLTKVRSLPCEDR